MKNKKININFSHYTIIFTCICAVLCAVAISNLIKINKRNNTIYEPNWSGVFAVYKDNNDEDDSQEWKEVLSKRLRGYSDSWAIYSLKDDYYVIHVNDVFTSEQNLDNILEQYIQNTSFFVLDEANYEKWSQGLDYESIYTIDDIRECEGKGIGEDHDYMIKLSLAGKGYKKCGEYSSNNMNKKIYMILNGEVICEKLITKPTDMFLIDGIHHSGDYNRIRYLLWYSEIDCDLSLVGYYIKNL